MRLEARGEVSRLWLVAAPFAAIAFTLVVASLFVAWAGAPLGRTYALIFEGGFGSRFAWSETLTRATPLILTGLSAAVAFRARFYNIGAEGQLYAGALAAVAVGGLHGGTGFAAHPLLLFPRCWSRRCWPARCCWSCPRCCARGSASTRSSPRCCSTSSCCCSCR